MLRTAFWDNLFFSLSCLISVFLGIPLAAAPERTRGMRGFLAAAALLAAFYISSRLGVSLGNQGVLPPVLAAGLPILGFGSWGLYQIKKHS